MNISIAASTVIIAFILSACSGTTPQQLFPTPTPDDVSLTQTPVPNQPTQTKLQLQINRNGFNGNIQMTLEDLPSGASAKALTLEPNQDRAIFTLIGLPKRIDASVNATVRLRLDTLEIRRSIPLNAAQLALDLPGGTHTQTIRNISANVYQSTFEAYRMYANFKGSNCQVMIQSPNSGLYICFNEAIRAGATYTLTTGREALAQTALITYFQGPATTSSQHAFWDSISGNINILAVSAQKITFNISKARFMPATGFDQNLAVGEFVLDTSTTVTKISNLP
jgi:hypothetical protein